MFFIQDEVFGETSSLLAISAAVGVTAGGPPRLRRRAGVKKMFFFSYFVPFLTLFPFFKAEPSKSSLHSSDLKKQSENEKLLTFPCGSDLRWFRVVGCWICGALPVRPCACVFVLCWFGCVTYVCAVCVCVMSWVLVRFCACDVVGLRLLCAADESIK